MIWERIVHRRLGTRVEFRIDVGEVREEENIRDRGIYLVILIIHE